MEELNLQNKKILIIAPHPDDESIGCGGVIGLYANQCTIVLMTDGSKGIEGVPREKVSDIRRKEFLNAMGIAGVKSWVFAEYKDGELINYPDCMAQIDFGGYDYIFLPWGNDNHPDHSAAFYYAITRLRELNIRGKVFEYEVHLPFRVVDAYIDITNVVDVKRAMIACHESQKKFMCYAEKAIALSKYRACSLNQPEKYYETYREVDLFADKDANDEFVGQELKLAKNTMFVKILSRWLERKISEEFFIANILHTEGVNSVSIYGFSDIGRCLYQELVKENFEIVEILDNRSLKNEYGEHSVVKPNCANTEVDALIVTTIFEYEKIEAEMRKKGFVRIKNLCDLVNS